VPGPVEFICGHCRCQPGLLASGGDCFAASQNSSGHQLIELTKLTNNKKSQKHPKTIRNIKKSRMGWTSRRSTCFNRKNVEKQEIQLQGV
jgi:hypothetical protein